MKKNPNENPHRNTHGTKAIVQKVHHIIIPHREAVTVMADIAETMRKDRVDIRRAAVAAGKISRKSLIIKKEDMMRRVA